MLEFSAAIRPKALPDNQEMRRPQDVDEVDLQNTDMSHRESKMACIASWLRSRTIKALCGKCDPAGFGRR